MTPQEFIEKSVHQELQKSGFKEGVCFTVSREAVDYWKQKSMFKKNVIADVMAWAKKEAKNRK